MPLGYMMVLAEIGDIVTEEAFHDWYDNEHIPLRFDVPAFLNFQRLRAVDGVEPSWAAVYDLTCVEDLDKPPYTTLEANRSIRELLTLRDIKTIDKTLYDAYEGNDKLPKPSALFDPAKAAPVTTFTFADVRPGTEEEYSKWLDEEMIPMLSEVPGWIRTRRFLLKDYRSAGTEGSKDKSVPAKFLTVNEFTHWDDLLSPELLKKIDTPWRQKIVSEVVTNHQLRRWDLYKSYDRNQKA